MEGKGLGKVWERSVNKPGKGMHRLWLCPKKSMALEILGVVTVGEVSDDKMEKKKAKLIAAS